MTNQLEKKDEDLVIKDKFCETMYELIRSEDFERIFGIVLKKVGRDKEYFLKILDKIKEGKKLEKEEKDLFLELLNSRVFQEKSKGIVKRLKGFTLEENKKFLEEYPTEEVIEYLKGVVNNEILDIPGFKYGVEIMESKEIGGENYLKLEIKGKDGESKYCVKKGKDIKNIKEEDFIFDDIGYIKEVNGKIYYEAKLNGKWGNIELGKEEESEKKCIFDYVSDIQEINGKIYYKAELNGKEGYVEYGKEEESEKKCIFGYVSDIQEINGKIYYIAVLNDKFGYVKLGKEEEAEKKCIFDDIEYIKEVNGKIYYVAKLNGKGLYVELGKE